MSTFRDNAYQQAFSQKGYVILKGLIAPDELKSLMEAFHQSDNHVRESFHTSHFSSDTDYKSRTHDTIVQTVFPKIAPYLEDYVPVFGNFMIKKAGGGNFLQMHADWTYVDEHNRRSVSVWIPFVDTNESNGCLGVIEYSHQFMNSLRGPGIRQNNFDRDRIWVKKYGKLLPMSAGDAIIYDHGLLHFSPPNQTGETRPALNLSLVPEGAEVIHYCIPEGASAIEKYIVTDKDFFIQYDHWQRPRTSSPVEFIPADTVKFIDIQMENYGKNYLSKKEQLKSYLKEWQYFISKE